MAEPVLVAGATGGVGQNIVHKLLAQGSLVRAITRDTSRARTLFGKQVELVQADVCRSETLSLALTGIRNVICAIGSRPMEGGSETPEQVDYEGVRNLAEAARAASVERFVLVSSIAVTNPEHPLNRFGQILTWKLRGEDSLRASGLPYTIVRPSGLTDEPGGIGIQFDQGDRITGRISRADVAEVCVRALGLPEARFLTFEIIEQAGPPPSDWTSVFSALSKDPR